jgi:hypothetical protein
MDGYGNIAMQNEYEKAAKRKTKHLEVYRVLGHTRVL